MMIQESTEQAVEKVISTCVENKEYFAAGLFEACLALLRQGKDLEVAQLVTRLAQEGATGTLRRTLPAASKKVAGTRTKKRTMSEETRRKLSELAKRNWQKRRAAAKKASANQATKKSAGATKAPAKQSATAMK